MRIGLDARFLTHPQHGGFKTYTECLVREVLAADPVNEYVVYVDRPAVPDSLPSGGRVTYRCVRSRVPLVRTALREQIGMRRFPVQDRVDLVHYLCNTAPVGMKTPFVVTIHDVIQVTAGNNGGQAAAPTGWRQAGIEAYSRWSIRNVVQLARRVITVSHSEKEQIVKELALPASRVCVTHLGPRETFRRPDEQLRREWRAEVGKTLSLPPRFILGVGYEPRKNIRLLMDAYAEVARVRGDVALVLLTAPPKGRSGLVRHAQERRIGDRVTFLSGVPSDQMPMLYGLAEMLVYPSEREGFGLPPLEAMACGTPTISMAMSSIPEVVGDGGLLLDSREPETWAGAILRLLSDAGLRESLVARGLRRASTFSWRRCALETIAVYRSVADELSGRRPAARSMAVAG